LCSAILQTVCLLLTNAIVETDDIFCFIIADSLDYSQRRVHLTNAVYLLVTVVLKASFEAIVLVVSCVAASIVNNQSLNINMESCAQRAFSIG
jgi:hypothetical protein